MASHDGTSSDLAGFVRQWSLDERSQALLEGLPADVLDQVIAGFDPPAETRNPDAKLAAFVRSRLADRGGGEAGEPHRGKGGRPPPREAHHGGDGGGRRPEWQDRDTDAQLVEDFVKHWALDETSERLLQSQPADLVRDIIHSFDPPTNTRNVSAKFCSFVKTRAASGDSGGGGGSHQATHRGGHRSVAPSSAPDVQGGDVIDVDAELSRFVEYWSLDESAQEFLISQSAESLIAVMTEFDPPPGTQNVSAKLMAFVRRGLGQAPMSAPSGAAQHQLPPLSSPRVAVGVGHGGGNRQAQHHGLSDFLEKWGVDAQNEALLRSSSAEHVSQVIQAFDPPPGTHNVNGKLASFIKSVIRPGGSGGGGGGGRGPSMDNTEAFASHWRLDEDALQTLRELPGAMRQSVMEEFDPPPSTANPSGKLKAFIRTRMASAGGGGGGGGRRGPPTGELDHRGPQRGGGGGRADDQGYGGGGSGGGGGEPSKRPRDAGSSEDVDAFIDRWRLDAEAQQTLSELPEEVLAAVVRDFDPPPDTFNVSAKLKAFARTRLKEVVGGGGGGEDGYRGGGGGGGKGNRDTGSDRGRDRVSSSSPAVGDFAARWGLDDKSEQMLSGLPQDLLEHVLATFEPHHTTNNPNAKLAAWVRALQTEGGGDRKRQRQS